MTTETDPMATDTAEIARSFGAIVRCLELSINASEGHRFRELDLRDAALTPLATFGRIVGRHAEAIDHGRIAEMVGRIEGLPVRFDESQQGQFWLGYHQYQYRPGGG